MTSRNPLLDRWDEVDAIFQAVLTRPPSERQACLRELCTDDELARLVGRLVASTEEEPDFLESLTAVLTAADEAAVADGTDEIGTRVGAYTLVEVIGRGGTGTVYRAERADGEFAQQVAVKVLRRGLDTADVLSRFRSERRILASLNHPHIAKLFDGGATADGRPFLVMELVDGQPITDYCDSRLLDVGARLRLFLLVAEAVQHAHRNLIVHRDLKPSNIMVTGDGTPMLLDFGIAKLLDDADSSDDAHHTRTGYRPMTPAYASPEQMQGEPITTASDVYQLGVLLYELLAGQRPHRRGGRSAADIERVLYEQEPPPPSVAAGAADEPAADPSSPDPAGRAQRVAATRRTDPRRLRQRLRGDLDTITLMAIRREPERRYASVEQLGADIDRFLRGLPVSARPDTWRYRTQKRLQRNPALAGVGAVLIALSIGYLVTVTLYAGRLEDERDRARSEAAKAAQVTAFLTELFEASDPDLAAGENPSALDLLDRGERRIDGLEQQPVLQAQMLNVLAEIFTSLGQYDRAEPLFSRALALRRELHAEPHADVALSLDRLGDVLQRTGRYDEAEPVLREAIRIAQLTGDRALESDSHTDLGHALQARGDYTGSEQAYREALSIRRQVFGDQHHRTAIAIHNLALSLETQERLDEALSLYWQALELKRGLLEPEHTSIALTLTTLGRLHTDRGEFDAAETVLEEALHIYTSRLGTGHARLGLLLNQLGFISARRGDFAAAESFFRESLSIHEAAYGATHREVAAGLNNLSYVLQEQGRVDDAVPMRRRVLDISRATLGDDHRNTGVFANNLASVLDLAGEHAEAEALYHESLDIIGRVLGDGHVLNASPLVGLGGMLKRTGRAAEAEPLLRRALAVRVEGGASESAIGEVQSLLGACLAALGRRAEAGPLLRNGYAALEEVHGPDARQTVRARERLEAFNREAS